VKISSFSALAAPLLLAGLFAVPASAHHSTAMFEWGKEVVLEGRVDKFEWTQPHTWTWFMVPGKDGKEVQWGLEGMSPSWLGRNGWTKHSLNPGDKVKMVIYPLRDGRNGGFTVRVTFADGKTIEELPQQMP